MAGYMSVKMKRKDMDDMSDDFSDFSLSSPARKIRRLGTELPPIMEEEPEIPLGFEHPLPPEEHLTSSMEQILAPGTAAVPSYSLNEERTLVLYKPVKLRPLQSSNSSNFTITINSDLIPGLKKVRNPTNYFVSASLSVDKLFWLGDDNPIKATEDEVEEAVPMNDCLAVIPWVSSQFPPSSGMEASAIGESEPMEAEVEEAATMDIEEDNKCAIEGEIREPGMGGGEGLHQWQQQHCMTPQLPQNTSPPLTWSW
ncbi:hypothetical protein HHK36_013474 [Tetracentron sinense]|uniref:Uncharacterized protein n=1 Tax=Tetracentron sinense TaxID=13715 RepID=A0A834Z879_TETSI|nr:hypothetical protein HHK36_033182 [Tetracentron sinense]KAF8400178.1 hypothetical protein HHK36_013474 [Tetracentron sinense]